jgi:hypothetical protein
MTRRHTLTASAALASVETGGSFLRRLFRGRRVIKCAKDWPEYAGPGWQGRVLDESVPDREHRKQGRAIGRWTLTSDTGSSLVVFLKRHYTLPRLHGLLALLFPRRAWSPGLQEWEHLAWAKAAGIPVPRAVAVGELLRPWGRLQGFLATEELAGMLPLHEAVPLAFRTLPPDEFARWKRGLCAEMARLTRELHRRRAFHKDLYFCHFYVAESDTAASPKAWPGRVVMIDFHRLGRHPWLWAWYTVKDLGQLLYSSDVPGVTARDRVRFWKLYRSGDWGTAGTPPTWLLRGVLWKWRQYQRQRARRLARKTRS